MSASDNPVSAYVALRDALTLDEVADINEVLLVRAVNQYQANEAAKARAKSGNR